MSGIFISYRRQDSQGFAGRLTDDLSELFGEERVFRDVEIAPGSDFSQAIRQAIAGCDALLVVIGKHWLEGRDAAGQQRIYHEDDWVRLEIEAGLASGKLLLPILVGGVEMPRESDLPQSIAPISRRQAFVVSDRRWKKDLLELRELLIQQVPGLKEDVAPEAVAQSRGQHPAGETRQEVTRETFRTLAEKIAEGLKNSSDNQRRQLPWMLRLLFNGLKRLVGFTVVMVVVYFTIRNYGDAGAQRVLNDLVTFFSGLLSKFLSYFR